VRSSLVCAARLCAQLACVRSSLVKYVIGVYILKEGKGGIN
jgi:hypothetical protein